MPNLLAWGYEATRPFEMIYCIYLDTL